MKINNIIKVIFLGISTYICNTFLLNATDAQGLTAKEAVPLTKLFNHTHSKKIEYKDEREFIEEALRDGITIEGEKYRFEIPEDLKKEAENDRELEHQIFSSIKKIEKMEGVSPKIIGFNLNSFNGKIYIEPFLGLNAK